MTVPSPRARPPARPVALLLAAVACLPSGVAAQAIPVVKVNLATRTFETNPPFDQAIVLSVAVPAAVTKVFLRSGLADEDGQMYKALHGWDEDTPDVRADNTVAFRVAPLLPNVPYRFEFCLATGGPPPAKPATREASCPAGTQPVEVVGAAKADVTTHFDTDFGILYSRAPGYYGAGTNVHYYLVPINKNESAGELGKARPRGLGTVHDEILKRVSLFAGVAFAKLHSEKPVEPQFAGVGNLVAGVGLRPRTPSFPTLDFFRLNWGVMWFVQRDANPVVTHDRTLHAPFVSLTADVTLQSVFGPLAALVGIRR